MTSVDRPEARHGITGVQGDRGRSAGALLGGRDRWRVLVAETQPAEATELVGGLQRHGHDPIEVATAGQALSRLEDADILLLDLDLPDLDGLEVCRSIRAVCDLPVIALTRRDSELDCVLALHAGADDYLVKPYSMRELLARMGAVMRRVQPVARTVDALVFGRLRVDGSARAVYLDEELVELTRKEFELLQLLALHGGAVVSRKQIMTEVWGDAWSRRTLDTHVSSVRGKLGDPEWIVTVRGVGFRLGVPGLQDGTRTASLAPSLVGIAR